MELFLSHILARDIVFQQSLTVYRFPSNIQNFKSSSLLWLVRDKAWLKFVGFLQKKHSGFLIPPPPCSLSIIELVQYSYQYYSYYHFCYYF